MRASCHTRKIQTSQWRSKSMRKFTRHLCLHKIYTHSLPILTRSHTHKWGTFLWKYNGKKKRQPRIRSEMRVKCTFNRNRMRMGNVYYAFKFSENYYSVARRFWMQNQFETLNLCVWGTRMLAKPKLNSPTCVQLSLSYYRNYGHDFTVLTWIADYRMTTTNWSLFSLIRRIVNRCQEKW